MAKSDLKLIYFNLPGRAEVSRFILAAAGKSFEDSRITGEQWKEIKPTAPFGQIPILQVDGKQYGQSKAIAAFLAREFNMYGKTSLEQLRIDEVVFLQEDFVQLFGTKVFFETDADKKKEAKKHLKEEAGPKFLGYFEKMLEESGTGFIVGDSLSLADIYIFDMYTGFLAPYIAESVDKFPRVRSLLDKVASNEGIKAYRESRK